MTYCCDDTRQFYITVMYITEKQFNQILTNFRKKET